MGRFFTIEPFWGDEKVIWFNLKWLRAQPALALGISIRLAYWPERATANISF